MTTTGWVLLWVGLVVASLVFYAVIALYLFRKAQGLFAQATETVEVFDQFAQAMADADVPAYVSVQAINAGTEQKQEWRMTRRRNLVRRAKRKSHRRDLTLRRWREFTIPPSKP